MLTLRKYLFREEYGQFLHLQCPCSKLNKFKLMSYSEIVVKGQNLSFIKKWPLKDLNLNFLIKFH